MVRTAVLYAALQKAGWLGVLVAAVLAVLGVVAMRVIAKRLHTSRKEAVPLLIPTTPQED